MSTSFLTPTINLMYVKNNSVYSALMGEETPLATIHDPEFNRLLEDILASIDNIINAPFEPITNDRDQYVTQADWDDMENELIDKEHRISELEDTMYDLQSDIERLEIIEEQYNKLTDQ